MEISTAVDLGREALWMVLVVSAPVMAIGLGVGLVVALFQAVTQLQEQTLQFVPKIVAMAVATVVFVPWIAARLVGFTRLLLGEPPF
jgi:flagellar biosynthesis protein FliQ